MVTLKQYFFEVLEEAAKEGSRVGIQHLYSHNKPELYSMSYDNFRTFVDFLQDNNGIITSQNTTASEKVDGMALKIGNDDKGFFVQSSYSGKVYEPDGFTSTIKYAPARMAFVDSFDQLKSIVDSITKGKPCTIQLEWLYSPTATQSPDNPGKVSFVVAQYHKHKIGIWSTFIILDIKSDILNPNAIRNSLLEINTDHVKFLVPHVDKFANIDLFDELTQAKRILTKIAKQQIPEKIEQLKGNRTRIAVQQRKQLESILIASVLPVQKAIYEKIVANLLKTDGILGDIEGYVIKAGPITFKVNNPQFMQAKFGPGLQDLL